MKKAKLAGVKTGVVVLISLICVLCLFTATACEKKLDVAELAIDENTVPAVAVAGEFSISGIKLLVTDSEGKVNEVFVTPSMLTTESKTALNTVGEQNVTVYYQGKTVTFTVLIVEAGTETVTVTFVVNGETLAKRTVVKGEPVLAPEGVDETLDGKVFAGWVDNSGNMVDLNAIEADVTVTAKYVDNANQYEVKFFDYKGNQVGDTQLVYHGNYATAPGWKKPAEIKEFEWVGLNNPIVANTTFNMTVKYVSYQVQYYYAFESNKAVKYTINSGKTPMVESVEIGKKATLQSKAQSALAAEGLEFIEWQNTSTVINADTDMIAIVKDRSFTITYNDGSNQKTTVVSGTQLKLKTDAPVKTGYTFNGQWQDAQGTVYTGTLVVQKDLVLVPIYNKKMTPVKLVFEFQGMFVDPSTDELVIDSILDENMFYQDTVDLAYVSKKLAELNTAKKGAYDGYAVESFVYVTEEGEEDVTSDKTELNVNVADAYHEFKVRAVNAALPTTGLAFSYDSENKGYIVSAYAGSAKNIFIPAEYDDGTNGVAPVIAIADGVFSGIEIIAVTIPAGVVTIGNEVFAGATLHTDINLPNVSTFGTEVFFQTKTAVYYAEDDVDEENPIHKEIKVTFGKDSTIKEIDGATFFGTRGIVEVVLPATVTKLTDVDMATVTGSIPEYTEEDVYNGIEKINLDNVTSIGNYALVGGQALTDIGSTALITAVGEGGFAMTALETLSLPAVTSIGDLAFAFMPELTSLSLATASAPAEGATLAFDMYYLEGDEALTEIVFGKGITAVSMTNGSLLVEKLTVGANVATLDIDATCLPALNTVVVDSANAKFVSADNVVFEKVTEGVNLYFYPANKAGDYTVPATVGSLALKGISTDFDGANINALTVSKEIITMITSNVTVEGNVTSVIMNVGEKTDALVGEVNAFLAKFTNGVKYVYLNVTGIDDAEKFIEDAGWTNVSVYDATVGTEIKYDVASQLFYKVTDGKAVVTGLNSALVDVVIPAKLGNVTVVGIDKDAFVNNVAIKTITVTAVVNSMGNVNGCTALESVVFNGWTDDADTAVEGFADTVIGQKNNVWILGNELIAHNTSADIDDPTVITADMLTGVTAIPDSFFAGSAFTYVALPDSVKSIGTSAFDGCASLVEIDLNQVIEIKDYAFRNSGLEKAILSEVVSLGTGAFFGCVNLESAYIPKKINSGNVPTEVFSGCVSLSVVEMPEVTGFSKKNNLSAAFNGCVSLTDISFISRFDKIEAYAFAGCTGLKSVDFTATSVTEIGEKAFKGCTGLEHVVFSANVTKIGDGAFANVNDDNNLNAIEFKGTGGLLGGNNKIPLGVFPESGYTFYIPASAQEGNLSLYVNVPVENEAPSVSFDVYVGFEPNGSLNMPALNNVLYINEAPVAPAFDGYVFAGWYTENSGSYKKEVFPYSVKGDVTFYAKYFNEKRGSFTEDDLQIIYEDVDGKPVAVGYKVASLSDDRLNDGEVYIPAFFTNDKGETLPVIEVDMAAFDDWTVGAEIVFPENIVKIVKSTADSGSNSVTKVSLPSTLKEIGEYAFYASSDLEEIVFADGIDMEIVALNAIENTVWYANAELEAGKAENSGLVVVGNVAVKYADDNAGTKDARTHVELPVAVTVLNDSLFENNTEVKEVVFNEALRVIGNNCFYNATALENIAYASGNKDLSVIEKIGTDAFTGTAWLGAQDMVIVGTVITKYNNEFHYDTITIPAGITEISAGAFYGASSKTIVFEKGSKLVKIGEGAFASSALESIALPSTVEEIGEGIFKNCRSLKVVDLSATAIKELPAKTFSGCGQLTTVTLSETVEKIVGESFEGCTSLTTLVAPGVVQSAGISASGLDGTPFYKVTATEVDQFIAVGKVLIKYVPAVEEEDGEETDKVVTVPDGIETIMTGVFKNLTSINEVVLPATVKNIEDSAFLGCSYLKKVTFSGEGLEVIGKQAFMGCAALENIDLPISLYKIDDYAFANSGLKEVILSDAVTYLGVEAFKNAQKLEYVKIGNGLNFIGTGAFANCFELYKIDWMWTTDTVWSDEKENKNSFDLLIENIVDTAGVTDVTNKDPYINYIKSIFNREEGYAAKQQRIYFNSSAYNYLTSAELNSFLNEWNHLDIIYAEGNLPKVSFLQNDSDGIYHMPEFYAEVIESIGTPALNGRTFMYWTVEGSTEPIALPYKVYGDVALQPVWFVNNISDPANGAYVNYSAKTNEGGEVIGYVVSGIKGTLADGTVYVESIVNGKPVVGIDLGENVDNADAVRHIVLTNAGAFNVIENSFRYFAHLEDVTLLGSGDIDMKVENGVLYSADGTTLIAYLYNYDLVTEEGVEKEVAHTSFIVPDTVTTILPYAFAASVLTEINLGKGVATIGHTAFNNGLATLNFAAEINITDATTESFNNTVWYNGNDNDPNTFGPTMTPYDMGGSTRGLFFTAGNILYGYTALSDVSVLNIPDTVNGFAITVIASELNNSGSVTFEEIQLPADLTKINANAFRGMEVTKNIVARGTALVDIAPAVFDSMSFYNAETGMLVLGKVLVKCRNTTPNIVVPDGIVAISDNAFSGGQVRTITLPSSLRYIGKEAFYNCDALEAISIPAGVLEIGESAFAVSKNLKVVTFNEKSSQLKVIGDGAFSDCSGLTSIAIPYSVESIGQGAFTNCTALTTVTYDYVTVSSDEAGNVVTTVVEKSKLTSLGQEAFYNCASITTMAIPDGVTAIEERTFYNCIKLTSVTFDVDNSKLKTIKKQAFMNCTSLGGLVNLDNPSLVTVIMPNSLITVGEEAFKNCSSMLGIRFNYNIADLGNNLFSGCARLARIDVYAATPARVAEDTFTRDAGNVKANYNLRIYVKNETSHAAINSYKTSWTKVANNIFERNVLPRLRYALAVSDATGKVDYNYSEEVIEKDIVVDPKYQFANTNYTAWKYYSFEYKDYDTFGQPTGDYKSAVTIPGGREADSNAVYLEQTDASGTKHQILIVDFDMITLLAQTNAN